MNKLFKSSIAVVALAVSPLLSATTVFEQTLGGDFNQEMPFKDLSSSLKTADGTLSYAFIPNEESPIKFDYFTAYLTPLTKKVAIIEASKKSDSVEKCESLSRYFSDTLSESLFPEFVTLEKLRSDGYVVDQADNQAVKLRVNPSKNHFMQFGCVPSNAETGKFTFIVSLSDASLKEVARKERDKIIATQN